jgi:nucleoid DNA-binding protein
MLLSKKSFAQSSFKANYASKVTTPKDTNNDNKMRKAVTDFLVKELRTNGSCKLHGFGNFVLKYVLHDVLLLLVVSFCFHCALFTLRSKPERERRNPRTGQVVLCPPTWALRFVPSKSLTESLNANRPAPVQDE